MAVATSLAMLSACDDGTLSFDLIKPWWFQFVLKEHLCSKVLPAYQIYLRGELLVHFQIYLRNSMITYEYETKVFPVFWISTTRAHLSIKDSPEI